MYYWRILRRIIVNYSIILFCALTGKELDATTADEKETASTYEIYGDYTFFLIISF